MSADDPSNPKPQVDFFISYTRADEAWAEWVAWVLEEAGFRTIVQVWDFRPASNFVIEMQDALVRSDRVVALLSEPYLRSAFGTSEWAAAFATDPTGSSGRLLGVRVGECQPPGLLAAVVRIDLVELDELEARRRLLGGLQQSRAKPEVKPRFPRSDGAGLPRAFPGQLPTIWNVPSRNPNFVGRGRQLNEMRRTLSGGARRLAVLAVAGLGGVGKTQLVIEHAWRRAADYDLVWWVPAEVPDAITGSLASLAQQLGLAMDDPSEVVSRLHTELARRERWLVVFDNAEDPTALAPYLPPAGAGHVLVTSRNPSWRGVASTLGLDVWPETQAMAFLLARTQGKDERLAREVAWELGMLPLALEQAGAYVEETGMGLDVYRALLAARRGEVLDRGTPAFYRQTVAATLGLAYDLAVAASPAAAWIMETCALLAPDDIPVALVSPSDALAAEDGLAALRRFSLIRRQDDALSVHRLVGAVVRSRTGPGMSIATAFFAVGALLLAFPNSPQDHRTWPRSARLIPHVLAVADCPEADAKLLAMLLNEAGTYLSSSGQKRLALQVMRRAHELTESAYDPDDHEVVMTLSNLAILEGEVGDPRRARDLQARALVIEEAACGPHDPSVARILSSLGVIYSRCGDLVGARDSLERALR